MKLRIKCLAILAVLSLFAIAFAEYTPEADKELRLGGLLGNLVAETLPVAEVGSLLFDVQEGVHQTLDQSFGLEIDHFYIRICSGDECLPVDPLRFGN